ncbi:C40 family peptidase [Aquimarina brevivitae]|uniref:Cell wall-associated NlpC family hydrolase n=1 Tax=Aquimarina brevivitae TaxID=323412 RepID=A0A4Q7PES0_9FLAO|nr:C40 family peptidase [Aquimarina brevivitae]RZS98963.1 cell wall-associated NlpC family hydrolase [Aquimarina brevivitae]
MKKILFLFMLSLLFIGCGGSKKSVAATNSPIISKKKSKTPKKVKSIIDYAKTFQGTQYKYGGTTKRGMDCSGLIYTSFKKEAVVLPRTSRAMATQGKAVPLKKATIGDLLFFKTNKNKNVINHVGLVVQTDDGIQFIHASTSRGVIISNLDEKYWNNCFVGARRIL